MKRFVLLDKNINVFAGLENGKITFEEDVKRALIFDERDNMGLKRRFYNTVTTLDFSVVEINKEGLIIEDP